MALPNNTVAKLSNDDIQEFIKTHMNTSVHELVLKYSGHNDFPIKEIAEQIECRSKAAKKLPGLSRHNLIYNKVSLEQASSEITASYKASRLSGEKIIDLTGGLGIDSIHFAKHFKQVYYCEMNEDLAEISRYNFEKIGINNITVCAGDGIEELKKHEADFFDCVFVDPSRREAGRRSVNIKYLQPDVEKHIDLFMEKSKRVCIKLAPAFDYTEAVRLFPQIEEFEVVSVNNECKEVLLYFNRKHKDPSPVKTAVVLSNNSKPFTISSSSDLKVYSKFSDPKPGRYFYEPDAAVRKAELTKILAKNFNFFVINDNSYFMVSDEHIKSFPGRQFKIIDVLKYKPNAVAQYLLDRSITCANIARSNFPLKPEELRKLFKLTDGGKEYLFFTKEEKNNLLFIRTQKAK